MIERDALSERLLGGSDKIKVDVSRLDNVFNLVGELVVLKSQLTQNPIIAAQSDPQLQSIVSLIDKTVRDLQDTTMAIRMTSMMPLFSRIRQISIELSNRLGKRIRFVIGGENTELDRALLDIISDPLLHLARNAVDHGVEHPQVRVNAGKNPEALVKISARQSNGFVVIEFEDDGRGIDRERVIERAIELGLLREKPERVSDDEVFQLLFHPGFSTHPDITEISGRGIGLDVVKSNVEKIGGMVQVESKEGQGSKFRLLVPLTTAVSEGMFIRFGPQNQIFVLPVNSVQEIVQVPRSQLTHLAEGSDIIKIRDSFYPLLRLNSIFNLHSEFGDVIEVVIVQSRGRLYALACHSVVGRGQVVVRALGDFFKSSNGVVGGAIMGDGSVSLVLDPDLLVHKVFGASPVRGAG